MDKEWRFRIQTTITLVDRFGVEFIQKTPSEWIPIEGEKAKEIINRGDFLPSPTWDENSNIINTRNQVSPSSSLRNGNFSSWLSKTWKDSSE